MARDRASATLARVSGAFALLGAAAVRVGLEGVGFFKDTTLEAAEFHRSIALIQTQIELMGVSYDDVLNMVKDTAFNTAVPLQEIQDLTYDLFSTVAFDNLEQAQGWLDAITQSAVAGQAPVQDVGRAVIAWINAMDVAPTVENVNKVLDVQFELVRKGAGNYAEFAGVVGKAIPPFIAAGQGVEELGGALAFMTRNGMSAAEAATSASRAVELLYSPKAIKGLEDLGIKVEDGNGNFRKMDDLLVDVAKKFEGLSDAERKLQFKEIFGTGSIQARRFFDAVLAEGNIEEFLFLMGEMRDATGEVAEAFGIMADEPAVALDQLKNRWELIRIEIGEQLLPLLKDTIIPILFELTSWWYNLDDAVKSNLVKWGLFGTIALIVSGAIVTIIGSIGLFLGLIKVFTGSWLIALGVMSGFGVLLLGLAAAIGYALTDWEKFTDGISEFNVESWQEKWIKVKRFFNRGLVSGRALESGDTLAGLFERIGVAWGQLVEAFEQGENLPEKIGNVLKALPAAVGPVVGSLIDNIVAGVQKWIEGGGLERLIDNLIKLRKKLVEVAIYLFTALIEGLTKTLPFLAETIVNLIPQLVDTLISLLPELVAGAEQLFNALIQALVLITPALIQAIVDLLPTIVDSLVSMTDTLIEGALTLFQAIVKALPQILPQLTTAIVQLLADFQVVMIENMPLLLETAELVFGVLTTAISLVAPALVQAIFEILIPQIMQAIIDNGPMILEAMMSMLNTMAYEVGTRIPLVVADIGGAIVTGIWDGIVAMGSWLKDKIVAWASESLPGWITDVLGISSPSKVFADIGQDLVRGLEKGWTGEMKSFDKTVKTSLDRFQRVQGSFAQGYDPWASAFRSAGMMTGGGPSTSIGQNIGSQVIIEKVETQADPIEIAHQLAWQILNS